MADPPPDRGPAAGAWLGALAAAIVASPQLIAMIQQAAGGGASVAGRTLAVTGKTYGVGLSTSSTPRSGGVLRPRQPGRRRG